MNTLNLSLESLQHLFRKKVLENSFEQALLIECKNENTLFQAGLFISKLIFCHTHKNATSAQDSGSLFGSVLPNDSEHKRQNIPCEQCSACKKNQLFIHPDLAFLFPTFTSVKANSNVDILTNQWRDFLKDPKYESKDLSSWAFYLSNAGKNPNIPVAQIDALMKKLIIKPYESGRRVVLIFYPEYLFANGNKLLKAIEEPTPNNHFILLSADPDAILKTIVSRCTLYSTYSENETSKVTLDDFYERWNNDDILKKTFSDFFQSVKNNNYTQLDIVVENISSFPRNDISSFLLSLQEALTPVTKNQAPIIQYYTKDLKPLSEKTRSKLLQILTHAHYAFNRNANIQMLLLDLGLQMMNAYNRGKLFVS